MNKFKCLLFVDDDYPTNYFHKVIAKEADIAENLIFFDTALKALAYLENHESPDFIMPEIIFLDINMPEMNSWEFTEAYEEKIEQKSSKIIILSTSFNPMDRELAEKNKWVSEFKTKPLTVDFFQELRAKY